MTTVYGVVVKNLSSTIRLRVSDEVFKLNTFIEFPVQKFEGYDNYDWKLRMFCQNGCLSFLTRSVKGFDCPHVVLAAETSGYNAYANVTIPQSTTDNDWKGDTSRPTMLYKDNIPVKNGVITFDITANLRVPVCLQ